MLIKRLFLFPDCFAALAIDGVVFFWIASFLAMTRRPCPVASLRAERSNPDVLT